MSYMRGDIYIWGGSTLLHLWRKNQRNRFARDYTQDWVRDCSYEDGVALPYPIFDALVAMRWAEMSPLRRKRAQQLALRWKGNFGCQALIEQLGYRTLEEFYHDSSDTSKEFPLERGSKAQCVLQGS